MKNDENLPKISLAAYFIDVKGEIKTRAPGLLAAETKHAKEEPIDLPITMTFFSLNPIFCITKL